MTTTATEKVSLRSLRTGNVVGRSLIYGQRFDMPADTAAERAALQGLVAAGHATLDGDPPAWWDHGTVELIANEWTAWARTGERFTLPGDTAADRRMARGLVEVGRARLAGPAPSWWATKDAGPQLRTHRWAPSAEEATRGVRYNPDGTYDVAERRSAARHPSAAR